MNKILRSGFCLVTMCLMLFSLNLHAQTDLAQGKATFASTADLPASNAVDGNGSTRWASAANVDPSWITVDLGKSYVLTSAIIDWEAANAGKYEIRGSTNNSTWTTIATRTGGTFGNRTDSITLSGTYRYVRMYGISRSPGNSWGYSIFSFKIYGSLPASSSSSTAATTNVALNKPVTASTADMPASNAVDGNDSTRWASAGGVDPSWIRVDLGSTHALSSVVIKWEAANAADYQVQGSNNDSSWTTLATRTGGTFGNRTDTVAISGSYRYVRIYGTKRSVGNAWGYSIFTLQVLGTPTGTPASSSSSAASNLPTAYPGYTGVYSGYTLKLDERFNSFNSAIWAKGDGAVGGESICRFQPQGVQVVNGNLELVIRQEYVPGSYSYDHKSEKGAYNYSCGELRTVPSKRIKYGRIETRMKAPSRNVATGYISSLFTYVHEGSPREWEEIDVELEGGRPDKFQANLIYGLNAPDWNATRQWGAWEHKIDIAPADQWRVYAIEWTPSAIKWYVDGVLVKTLDQNWIDCNPSCVAPQVTYTPIPDNLTDLMMNFWIPNDGIQNVFGGNKYGNVYPMVTQYDWVRIYQLNSHPLTNW